MRSAAEPVDAHQVAAALRIHVTTARFHLGVLEDRGLVRRSGDIRRGAGRPRLTYEIAPRLDYSDIVALFAAHLAGTAGERERRALRIGADLAHRLHLARRRSPSSVTDLVLLTLGELGFQVSSVLTSFGEVSVQVCACPLAEVATSAPEVVRGIQQGLIQEVVDRNAEVLGLHYQVTVVDDPQGGMCEVTLILCPGIADHEDIR